jgi:hypothetical protein
VSAPSSRPELDQRQSSISANHAQPCFGPYAPRIYDSTWTFGCGLYLVRHQLLLRKPDIPHNSNVTAIDSVFAETFRNGRIQFWPSYKQQRTRRVFVQTLVHGEVVWLAF